MRALCLAALLIVPASARAQDTIVLWAMPEAQAKFGATGLKAIETAANGWLASLGVGTKLVVFTGKSLSRAKADEMGKLAVLGTKKNVIALSKANGLVTAEDAAWLERQWEPDKNNPELSDFSASGDGKYTVLSVEASSSFSAETGGALTPAQSAALFALHGVGHQAGISHPASENFNDDGARLLSMLTGKMFVSDGVVVQLKKRPAVDLFKRTVFETAPHRDDVPSARQRPQRQLWLAAFKPR